VTTRQHQPSRGLPPRVLLAQGLRKAAASSTSVSRWTTRDSNGPDSRILAVRNYAPLGGAADPR